MKKIILCLVCVLSLLACETNTAQTNNTLDVKAYQQLMAEKKNVQLVDVRTADEYNKEHLMDAVNMDYNASYFEHQLMSLDKDKPTFIYCLSGGRSGNALKVFSKLGFKEVYNMQGGILAWKDNNMPLNTVNTGWVGMTKEEFTKIINDKIPTLIDFRATWCGPCKQLHPILEELKKEYAGKLNIVEIDIDHNKSLADGMHIKNIPLMVYYKGGKVAMNIEGFLDKKGIISTLGLK